MTPKITNEFNYLGWREDKYDKKVIVFKVASGVLYFFKYLSPKSRYLSQSYNVTSWPPVRM